MTPTTPAKKKKIGIHEANECHPRDQGAPKSERSPRPKLVKSNAASPRSIKPGGGGRDESVEPFLGHHERVSEFAKVSSIAHLLREDIARIDDAVDVMEINFAIPNAFSHRDVAEVDVAHAFRRGTFGPIHRATIVVEQKSGRGRVR